MPQSWREWRRSSHSGPNGGECVEVSAAPGAWRKASRSNEIGDNCVEVADASSAVALRDSKDPDGGVLVLSRKGFGAVLAAVRGR
ncbi:DUF397 domain-containing protein [Actinomadura logoneensis]|uniref:DUF397 domain-containing protein n=1 Tax=Actinomadura logoneensis TaxID=2293572 RepID=A0A372JK96_9ACTN|nr:DUF397 domain-containing protein [Actinomadura logoneensis]RFU40370.1 DUF397 domain-containing protein [Actinomadura logoneensis]